MSSLILPGTVAFDIALAEIPPVPNWRAEAERTGGETYLICRSGGFGLMETADQKTFEDYCYGGELDERQHELDDYHDRTENIIFAGC